MIKPSLFSPLFLLASAACLTLSSSEDPRLPMLDSSAWARWRSVEGTRLSRSGEQILYVLSAPDGRDGELRARGTADGASEVRVERGTGGRFDAAGEWLVCKVEASYADKRAAELAEEKEDDLPKAGLALIELATGERRDVERVSSFALPEKGGHHLAWKLEKKLKDDQESGEEEESAEQGAEEAEEEGEEEEELSRAEKKKKKAKAEGRTLMLRDLSTGNERSFEDVQHYVFDEMGTRLAFVVSTKEGETDGLFLVDLAAETAEPLQLLAGKANYGKPVFSEDGRKLACLSNLADYESEAPHWSLYSWLEGGLGAQLLMGDGAEGMSSEWSVSEHREPWFSEGGTRIFFGCAPSPLPDPEPQPKAEEVVVDIWNWRDTRVQPQQLVELEKDQQRSYLAVWHFESERMVQLGSEQIPSVSVPREGECPQAIGTSDLPYRRMRSWDMQAYQDVWAIDVESGATRQLLRRQRGRFRLSPGGKYVFGWDGQARTWLTVSTAGGRPRHVSASLPHPVDDQRHDTPQLPRSYGFAGWSKGDKSFVIHDEHDLWSLDPENRKPPVCLTRGAGREAGLELRWVDLDSEEEWMGRGPWLLASRDLETRDSGFWRIEKAGASSALGEARELVSGPWRFSRPTKADEGELLWLSRESYGDYPDVWVANSDLSQLRRMSTANPQRAEYRWGSSELVHWSSTTGKKLDGILYKPDDFDPTRKYPLLVYFYERSADGLHRHHTPIPSRSTIRFPHYTSRGYLIFVPDILYEEGYPGRSAEHAVLPGITSLIDQGFVDPERIGVQGHSWGGYQIAWLVTQTKLFAAAVAGAPVSNMTSAYGGIRWETGLSRMFQYERSQSRIGDTLWNASARYIENSPLFFVDSVETPLLILHNDRDGAVPWYQGIELFMALRRLDKPSWLLNYNGEAHGLKKFQNKRDYALRMSQFFDHYLLGAPAPAWLESGVPATEKGRSLGLDLPTHP